MNFRPSFFLRNRHIQTLYSSFFRKSISLEYNIEKYILKDGDFIEAYWHHPVSPSTNKTIVILFHGLTGSHKSPYIQGIMKRLADEGISSVLMHFRSCSGIPNDLPRSYHSGDTADAKEFIASLKKRFPEAKLCAIGYSLGGNMLLKLLGEEKSNSLLSAAVSVSAPLQLDICADAINQGFSLLYQEHLMKNLRDTLRKKYDKHDMESLLNFKKEDIKNLKTFWDFDEIYTAPIHGFKSAKEYYIKCSARQFLKYIQTDTLIIHSIDDPFMNKNILPTNNELSSSITLDIVPYGGHVGFIEGTLFKPKYWLENKIISYIKTRQFC